MKKHKIYLFNYSLLLLLAMVAILITVHPIHTDAGTKPYYTITVSSQPLSTTSIQLKWKKQKSNVKNPSKFKIYRCSSEKENRAMKDFKLIATVSGKTFSYTDKKLKPGKRYFYIIRVYKNIKGKRKLIGETLEEENVTGPGHVGWYEYQYSDTDFSPSQIELRFSVDNGMKPTGYQIYRKAPGEKYQKIKTIKTSKREVSYVDKKVTAGTQYSYKVRAYKKYGSKTLYGKKSEVLQMSAVNYQGKFTSTIIEENSSSETVTVQLTSNQFNGDFYFTPVELGQDFDEEDIPDASAGTNGGQMKQDPIMILDAWSLDSITWNTAREPISLTAGKSVYLRFRSGNNVKLTKEYLKSKSVYREDVRYNGLSAIFSLKWNGTGQAWYNMEFIH